MIRYARAAEAIPPSPTSSPPRSAAGTRRKLVERLRADGDVLFELVAEEDGEVVGHILFSRLWADRAELYGALAPLAVPAGRQSQGVGSRTGAGARLDWRPAGSAATASWCGAHPAYGEPLRLHRGRRG